MSKELELKDYFRIVRKRLLLIVTIVIAACIVSGLYSYLVLDPVYQASTKLIVNKSNENAVVGQLDINTVNLNIRLIDTYKEIIKTPAVMDKVVAEHPEFGLTSEQLTSRVKVSSVNNTQVMTVSIQDLSYEKATELVNAISKVFIQELPTLMQVDNVSLLAAANPAKQPSPVAPKPVLNIAIAFIVSIMIGIGISLLLEYLDDTLRTERDVEQYLGVPTIAMIPRLKDEDIKSNKNRKSESLTQKGEHRVELHTQVK
ncbi:YveK family protein [Cohnella faecalis]|uniref:Lipopolysaccharide biosynthesis protein n=1 Tax=Cohnella faecalis TaxID=2315694 RepID=A0A398CPI0_9BACL|nr:Wzz/FepE/Etk N-terminal domain-containing protein [Cohnella faecalis]RIE04292.1 lipopolysaccharide biosynthesis protein [Cohnella faecalis]